MQSLSDFPSLASPGITLISYHLIPRDSKMNLFLACKSHRSLVEDFKSRPLEISHALHNPINPLKLTQPTAQHVSQI